MSQVINPLIFHSLSESCDRKTRICLGTHVVQFSGVFKSCTSINKQNEDHADIVITFDQYIPIKVKNIPYTLPFVGPLFGTSFRLSYIRKMLSKTTPCEKDTYLGLGIEFQTDKYYLLYNLAGVDKITSINDLYLLTTKYSIKLEKRKENRKYVKYAHILLIMPKTMFDIIKGVKDVTLHIIHIKRH